MSSVTSAEIRKVNNDTALCSVRQMASANGWKNQSSGAAETFVPEAAKRGSSSAMRV